jgi:tetratricopeptide (TPR) repeat protein
MKRIILTGILAMAAGIACLAAQAQSGKAAPAAAAQPQPKSQEELKAVQAVFQAQDSDATIKAAEELLTKFADTQFKEAALAMESEADRSKIPPDPIKAQIYAERVLALNPSSLQANITVGEIIIQTTPAQALDKEEQLAKAQKYLAAAQDSLKSSPKPNPQIPDQDWADIKKETSARVHNDLGMLASSRKDWPTAITEFNAAIAEGDQPAYQARLASTFQQAGKNADAIALCDKILADPQLHPQIKAFVTNVKTNATRAAAQAPAPAPQK